MILFWVFAASLTFVSLLFVVLPLWRAPKSRARGPEGTASVRGAGLVIYRHQLADLEADRLAGVISDTQYQSARIDLQRSLLEMEANDGGQSPASAHSWRWPAGIATLILLPVLSVMIYISQGGGALALDQSRQVVVPAASPDGVSEAEVAIEALRDRLDKAPDDYVGWALLGRVYHSMGQTRAAAQAYAKSLEHGGDREASILVDSADVYATLHNGDLQGRPSDLLRRALEIEPDHITGLWLAGTAAYRAGNYQDALEHWQRLAQQLPPESETGAIIRGNLAEVEARLGGEP
jgi:cytochrome c-type biogenesis protein CcmH